MQQLDAVTIQGVAGVSFSIDRPGLLEVRAESDPALTSVTLQLNVTGEGFSVTVIAPTPIVSETPTPEPTATPQVTIPSPLAQGYPGLGGWFATMLILGGLGVFATLIGKWTRSTRWAVRWILCIIAGGLLAYTYLAVHLPGAMVFLQRFGWLGMIGVVLAGAMAGFGTTYAWWRFSKGSMKQPD